jgi:hypothetical protein
MLRNREKQLNGRSGKKLDIIFSNFPRIHIHGRGFRHLPLSSVPWPRSPSPHPLARWERRVASFFQCFTEDCPRTSISRSCWLRLPKSSKRRSGHTRRSSAGTNQLLASRVWGERLSMEWAFSELYTGWVTARRSWQYKGWKRSYCSNLLNPSYSIWRFRENSSKSRSGHTFENMNRSGHKFYM